jgi:hypothetical protein
LSYDAITAQSSDGPRVRRKSNQQMSTAAPVTPAVDPTAEPEALINEKAWWREWLGSFQSLELENKGSVARDHLALGTHEPAPQ